MIKTKGYTYFAIKTDDVDFDLSMFNTYLSIQPTNFTLMSQNGKVPKCTIWELSSGKLTNPFYFEEIEKLLDILEPHKLELLKLKQAHPKLTFVLQVVIFLGDETPGLHFSERTISFMNDFGGAIDCDIYNEK